MYPESRKQCFRSFDFWSPHYLKVTFAKELEGDASGFLADVGSGFGFGSRFGKLKDRDPEG